jgi:hypothetical protein
VRAERRVYVDRPGAVVTQQPPPTQQSNLEEVERMHAKQSAAIEAWPPVDVKTGAKYKIRRFYFSTID